MTGEMTARSLSVHILLPVQYVAQLMFVQYIIGLIVILHPTSPSLAV